MENHPDEKPVFISGKQVRATLLEGRAGRSAHHAREHVEDPHRGDGGEAVKVLESGRACRGDVEIARRSTDR